MTQASRAARVVLVAMTVGVVGACSRSEEPAVATDVSISAGRGALDAIGETSTLTATIKDQSGNGMAGIAVAWSVDGLAVSVGSAATTNGDGKATTTVTALANGNATVSASAAGGAVTASLAVQVSQVAASLTRVGGDGQTGGVNEPLADALQVKVADRLGGAIAGATVTLAAMPGSGAVGNPSATTGADGIASTPWTLGTSASVDQQVTATLGTFSAVFSATPRAGPPASVTASAGNGQTATVSSTLPIAPAVLVRDEFANPVPGVTVTFAPTTGSGTVTGATTTTNSAGVATAGGWTLGPSSGAKWIAASVDGGPSATIAAIALPGAVIAIEMSAGDGQTASANTSVAIPPAVKAADGFGNGVPNVSVTFAVVTGGGTITTTAAVTNASGIASVGNWKLGPNISLNSLTATVAGFPTLTFTAVGAPAPVGLSVVSGSLQTGAVGAPVLIPPTVRVFASGGTANAVAGALVRFTVTSGGGTVTAATRVTGADGTASVGWTLGPSPGANSLRATVDGVSGSGEFSATAGAAVPATITVGAGDNTAAMVNTETTTRPSVVVRDAAGNPAVGVSVRFAVTGGGGNVGDPIVVTDYAGTARVTSWTLGPTPNINTITATVVGSATPISPVTVTAYACAGGGPGYGITLCPTTPMTTTQSQAFANAAARWGAISTRDMPDIANPRILANECGMAHPSWSFTIDDVVIFAALNTIDGVGGILGSAGPCHIRIVTGTGPGNRIPATGTMRFDTADIQALEASGQLESVILHEMGHVLGIGSLWNPTNPSTPCPTPSVACTTTRDTFYPGVNSRGAFDALVGGTYVGGRVPVENLYGLGTINSHWRESVLRNELMTGFLDSGPNPLSLLTVRSLQDLGYTVNLLAADPFSLALSLRAPGPFDRPPLSLGADVFQGPRFTIDAQGRTVRVIPP